MSTIKVKALAAIDENGGWVIYGFPGLDSVNHFHETGVTDDLEDHIRIYKIELELERPSVDEIAVARDQLSVERVEN